MNKKKRFCLAMAGLLSHSFLPGCGDAEHRAEAAAPSPAVTVVEVAEDEIRPSVTFTPTRSAMRGVQYSIPHVVNRFP
jgi:hypothetical protein